MTGVPPDQCYGRHRGQALGIFKREQVSGAPEIASSSCRSSRAARGRTFPRYDIGLDTFPYNGHTTSLDSFYMGVPVVTLGRQGPSAGPASAVENTWSLGMPELIADTAEQYVQIAAGLAGDIRGLLLWRGLSPADAILRR